MHDLEANVWPASTRDVSDTGKIQGLRPTQKARRRKAAALNGARHSGPYTTVSMTVRLTRGSGKWIEVSAATGRFYVPVDAGLLNLMNLLIKGGHWVEG